MIYPPHRHDHPPPPPHGGIGIITSIQDIFLLFFPLGDSFIGSWLQVTAGYCKEGFLVHFYKVFFQRFDTLKEKKTQHSVGEGEGEGKAKRKRECKSMKKKNGNENVGEKIQR